jgi:histidine ammonia-lyase
MIPQYTAASIASQNKQYCTPAVIDSIDSSNGQEDHVSMGANSATKCYKVLENTKRILAIELMNASQAIAFRNGKKSSTKVEALLTAFRKEVPFVEEDVQMNLYIAKAVAFIEKSLKETV